MSTTSPSRRRTILATIGAALLMIGAACSGGEKSSSDSSAADGPTRKLFQPASVVGPDAFAPTFETTNYDVPDTVVALSGEVDSDAPGIYAGRTYGGSGSNICDVEKMIEFLEYYQDRGRAWAAIQGIAYEEIGSFIRSLEPVYLLQNISVTMFGFKNGASYGYEATIAAGTAILIDDQGMPRARCACGNPLLSSSVPEPATPSTVTETNVTETTVTGSGEQETTTTTEVPGDQTTTTTTVPGDEVECPELVETVRGTEWRLADGRVYLRLAGTGTWVNVDDELDFYESAENLPGWSEECFPPDEQTDCPEEEEGNTYTDPSGTVWTWSYDPETGEWSWVTYRAVTDGLGGFVIQSVPTHELPGVSDDCGEPECPPEAGWDGEIYTDPTGAQWVYVVIEGDIVIAGWVPLGSVDAMPISTEELPAAEGCGPPQQRIPDDPECPDTTQGTRYIDLATGTTWVSTGNGPDGIWWYPIDEDGFVIEGVDPVRTNDLPGVNRDDCPEGTPCPPARPSDGETWTDRNGDVWVYTLSRSSTSGWDNTATEEYEEIPANDLTAENDCPEPQDNPCPPGKPIVGQTWVAPNGDIWEFTNNGAGGYGWDNIVTPEFENHDTAFLRRLFDCGEPTLLDCPTLDPNEFGGPRIWLGNDGVVYVWSDEGYWLPAGAGPDALPIYYTVQLPGYRDLCLPPCPPLQMSPTDNGVWIDPFNNEIWAWDGGAGEWFNFMTGDTVGSSIDLPYYRSFCLDPCPPETEGQPTDNHIMVDDEPVQNPEVDVPENADQEVVLVTGTAGADVFPADRSRIRASVAPFGPCNESGCVESVTSIENGHVFTDTRGVDWVFSSEDGYWRSELGEAVTYHGDIPGYQEICDDPRPDDRFECPEEAEGNEYVDSQGRLWTWVGGNGDPEDSDHGRKWWWAGDESTGEPAEYRYTSELEEDGRYGNCVGDTVVEGDVVISLEVKQPVCAGDDVYVIATVVTTDGSAPTVAATIDGEPVVMNTSDDTTFEGYWTPSDTGTFDIEVNAVDGSGATGTATTTVEVVDCTDGGTPTDSSVPGDDGSPGNDDSPTDSSIPPAGQDNRAPTVSIKAPTCVEISTEKPASVSVTVSFNDPDGDPITGSVDLTKGSTTQQVSTLSGTGSGSKVGTFTMDYTLRGTTVTVKATVKDDSGATGTASASIQGVTPGGCGGTTPTQPSTPSTTAAPATTTTTTTLAPNLPATITSVKCERSGDKNFPFRLVVSFTDPEKQAVGVTDTKVNGSSRTASQLSMNVWGVLVASSEIRSTSGVWGSVALSWTDGVNTSSTGKNPLSLQACG